MSKNRKIIIILAITTVVLISLAAIGKSQGWIGKQNLAEVDVEEVTIRTITETVTASGKIFPELEVKITPDVSGEVVELYVTEGDSVKAGDLLVRINPDIYYSVVDRAEAAVNQARANLATARARTSEVEAQFEQARLSWKRNQQLYSQKVISDAEYEQAQAGFQSMEANLEAAKQNVIAAEYSVRSAQASAKEARDNLQRTTIHAPIEGIISYMPVERGERVVGTTQFAGTEIIRVADFSVMEVQVNVSENDILRVNIGDSAKVEIDAYPDRNFKGKVTRISNTSNLDVLTSDQVTNFTVSIRLNPESYANISELHRSRFAFRPGMSATAHIFTAQRANVPSVPIQSVTVRSTKKVEEISSRRGGGSASSDTTATGKPTSEDISEKVFVLEGDKVKAYKVETGIQDGQYIEIKSGLEVGTKVVTGPYRAISRTLSDDDGVRVAEE